MKLIKCPTSKPQHVSNVQPGLGIINFKKCVSRLLTTTVAMYMYHNAKYLLISVKCCVNFNLKCYPKATGGRLMLISGISIENAMYYSYQIL